MLRFILPEPSPENVFRRVTIKKFESYGLPMPGSLNKSIAYVESSSSIIIIIIAPN